MRSIEPDFATSSTELVARIATLAAELGARPAPESGSACYEQVETLGRAADLIESAIAARVIVATRSGQVAEWGHTSPTAWLRTSLDMRHARAEERAVLAAQLPRLPHVAKRLATGDLSAGYANAIATGIRRLDEADCGKAEDLLLRFVDEGHSVAQITRFADRIKDLIAERDDTAAEPEDGRHAERQWWTLHRSGPAAFVKGRFGAELTALIKAKLEPLAKPCGADDPRDHAERLADALQTYLSNGDSRWDPILVVNLEQSPWLPPSAGDPAPGSAAPPRPAPTAAAGRPAQRTTTGDPTGEQRTPRTAHTDLGATGRRAAQPPTTSSPARKSPKPVVMAPAESSGRGESAAAGEAESDPPQAPRPLVPHPPPERDAPGRTPQKAQPDTAAAEPCGQGESPGTCPAESEPAMRWAPRPPNSGWPFDGTPYTARLADGTPIPPQRARSILLNAGFSTLILGTDGHPLYLGRRVRCATPAQRRVLLTRYSACVVEGCEIPATGCQVDHVDGWENGQPSDIDRLVLCCAWHNRYKWRHPDRVIITQRADGRYTYQIARPSTNRYSRSRNRPTSPPSDRGP